DVGVTAQGAFLHLHIGNADVEHQQPELFQEEPGLTGTGDIGGGDNLDQGNARPVVIHQRVLGVHNAPAAVDQLARLLLQMQAGDGGAVQLIVNIVFQIPIGAQGIGVLGDLVGFGQIWVEVVLAVEPAEVVHL